MASYDGSEFRGIDDDFVDNDAPLDTWAENELRNQEYWLHQNQGIGAGGNWYNSSYLRTAKDAPQYASRAPAYLMRIPYLVLPDLDRIDLFLNAMVRSPIEPDVDGVVFYLLALEGVGSVRGEIAYSSEYYAEQLTLDLEATARDLEVWTTLSLTISSEPFDDEIQGPDRVTGRGEVLYSGGEGVSPTTLFTETGDFRSQYLHVQNDSDTKFMEFDPLLQVGNSTHIVNPTNFGTIYGNDPQGIYRSHCANIRIRSWHLTETFGGN